MDRIVQVHAVIYDCIEYDVLNRAYGLCVPNAPPARTVMIVQIEAGFEVMLDVTAPAQTRQAADMTHAKQAIEPCKPDGDVSRAPDLLLSPVIRAVDFVFLRGWRRSIRRLASRRTAQ